MLKNKKFKVEIIQLYHDILAAGHGGMWKTTELVMKNYWWPEVTKDIEKYVDGCDMFQRMKNQIEVPVGKLMIDEIPERPQMYLTVEFITQQQKRT